MNFRERFLIDKVLAFCLLVVALFSTSCTTPEQKQSEAKTQPNILYIMSDDHTSQAFGIYGSRLAGLNPTPTLDRIAKEGIIFDNAFCTNGICTPSRACITSGQYSQANGVLDLEGELPKDKQYLPIELKKLGYQTAMIGKWHLKAEPNFDFYKVLVGHGGQGSYFDPEFVETGMKFGEKHGKGVKTVKHEGHSSDVITDLTLDWFKTKRDKTKPFFLMHHYKAPHDNFEHAPRYNDYLADDSIPEPASLYDNKNNGSVGTRGMNDSLLHDIGSSISKRNTLRDMGRDLKLGLDSLEGNAYTHAVYQEYLKRYLRCVKGVDDNLARLFKYLEAEGILDNTIIVYTGDQGFMLGEHDYIDKRWMYEEAHRMPFFVRYPKSIKAGQRTDAIINNVDFAPTLVELAGGKVPDVMQGDSFKEILESGKEPEGWKQATYYRYWMHMAHKHANPAHFGIRTKTQKLIFFYGRYWVDTDTDAPYNKKSWGNRFGFHTPAAWEFYDLAKDPNEMNNLYGDPAYKSTIDSLKNELKRVRKDLNEEDDVNYPHIQKVIDENWDL